MCASGEEASPVTRATGQSVPGAPRRARAFPMGDRGASVSTDEEGAAMFTSLTSLKRWSGLLLAFLLLALAVAGPAGASPGD